MVRIKLFSACFLLAAVSAGLAQEAQKLNMPPKVLVISREFVKPGRTGAIHEKSEAAFVHAFASQNWPTHYLAIDSLSGKPRSLFLIGYDSFDAWEKDTLAIQKNTALNGALQRAGLSDADVLSDMDGATFRYREDLSLHPGADLPHMRYFEIIHFQIRPGHDKDWEQLVKLFMQGYDKAPEVQWATYEVTYGVQDGTFLAFVPRKSGEEVDHALGQGKDFESAMGEEGMKQIRDLSAAAVEWSQTNLFAFNPRMSYVSPEFTKADPDFWGTRVAVAAHSKKKAEEAKE